MGGDVMSGRLACAAGLLAVLVGVLALTVGADLYYVDPVGLFWRYAAGWAVFAAAVWAVRGVPGRQAAGLVVIGAVAVAATGLLAPPRTSTDSYRYAWDGRVQAAGFSPYDHAPADPALAPLRDRWLFPTGAECAGRDRAPLPSTDGTRSCTRINRPAVHTIYPPVAEAYFWLVHQVSPPGNRHKPLQIAGALLALATTGVLLSALRRREGGGAPYAACWAWCPAVPVEAVNNAHVDVLGVLLTVVALTVAVRRRSLAGLLLGAATAAKLLPATAVPGALSGILAPGRARTLRALAVLGPAALVIALAYLPYVLASRASVLGYLFGYVDEEGYGDAGARNRYALLRLVLPDTWALPAALVIVGLAVLHVLRYGDADRPWRGALLVTGIAFLAFTPGYSWYALLLVALVALDGRWEWLGVPLASAAAYLGGPLNLGTAAYTAAMAVVLCGALGRDRAGMAVGRSGAGRDGGGLTGEHSRSRRTGRPTAP